MRPDDFATNAPGRVKRSMRGHWVFEPDSIPPPDEQLIFDMPTIGLMARAEQALGRLQGVGQMLPNPHLLIRPFLRREAVSSSRIEGTVTSFEQLLLFEVEPDRVADHEDADEVLNYVAALEFGVERLRAGEPLHLRLIREIHAVLLRGVRGEDKRPGEFRSCDVFIGRAADGWDRARFVPPLFAELPPLLANFERFLNEPSEMPLAAQLAIMHYQFETIHPFMDGNGRIGRLLFALLLMQRGALTQPLLYLSDFLQRHAAEYREHLLAVSQRAAWVEWIRFIAQGVQEQASDAARRGSALLRLAQEYRDRLAALSRSASAVILADQLLASPYITTNFAVKILKQTPKAARTTIERLVTEGILQEVTTPGRSKVYVAGRVLELLQDVGDSGASPEI